MKAQQRDLGLALGGGGMLGASHIGVLEVLEENGIRPGIITGASAGGLVAALYAAGISPARIRKMALEMKKDDLFAANFNAGTFLLLMLQFVRDLVQLLSLLPRGLLSGERIRNYVDRSTGKKGVAQVDMPVGLMTVDLITGNRVVFTNRPPMEPVPGIVFVREAPLGLAVQATTAIPGVFEPVSFKGMLLVDGGIAEMVPAPLARLMGAKAVVAVNLVEKSIVPEPHSLVQVLLRSVEISSQLGVELDLADADLVIRPPAVYAELGDFRHVLQLMDGGRRSTLEALSALQELL